MGTNRRSWQSCKEAVEFVRSGGIGHVTVARCFHIHNEWPNGIGNPPDGAAAERLGVGPLAGPGAEGAVQPNRTYYNFRWFYDYSGGQLTNFGVHYVDMMRWCLGQDSPRAVTAMGGKYAGIQDNREIPDTLEVMWEFDGLRW